jgi:hypothetical protein
MAHVAAAEYSLIICTGLWNQSPTGASIYHLHPPPSKMTPFASGCAFIGTPGYVYLARLV